MISIVAGVTVAVVAITSVVAFAIVGNGSVTESAKSTPTHT